MLTISKIRIIKIILGICFLGLFFNSCTEDITLPLDNSAPMLVVDGNITSDTMAHIIRLGLSNDFYSNAPAIPITDAIVNITEGENIYSLQEDSAGIYKTASDFYALPNKLYRLNISNVDINKDGAKEEYWAESSFSDINPLDSIAVKTYPFFNTKRDLIHITGFFQ